MGNKHGKLGFQDKNKSFLDHLIDNDSLVDTKKMPKWWQKTYGSKTGKEITDALSNAPAIKVGAKGVKKGKEIAEDVFGWITEVLFSLAIGFLTGFLGTLTVYLLVELI